MSGKGKKKKGKRKKQKKVKEFGPKSIIVPRPPKGPLINLELKLATWDFMDYVLRDIPLYSTLLEIRNKIIDRHGGAIMDVTIYHKGVSSEHELKDLTVRLVDVFPDSRPNATTTNEEKTEDSEPKTETLTLYYDFETDKSPDPILEARIHLHPEEEDEEMLRLAHIDDFDFD